MPKPKLTKKQNQKILKYCDEQLCKEFGSVDSEMLDDVITRKNNYQNKISRSRTDEDYQKVLGYERNSSFLEENEREDYLYTVKWYNLNKRRINTIERLNDIENENTSFDNSTEDEEDEDTISFISSINSDDDINETSENESVEDASNYLLTFIPGRETEWKYVSIQEIDTDNSIVVTHDVIQSYQVSRCAECMESFYKNIQYLDEGKRKKCSIQKFIKVLKVFIESRQYILRSEEIEGETMIRNIMKIKEFIFYRERYHHHVIDESTEDNNKFKEYQDNHGEFMEDVVVAWSVIEKYIEDNASTFIDFFNTVV